MEDKIIKIEYKPTKKQTIFHKDKAKYRLFGGGVGGGKSVALTYEAIKQNTKYAGNRGLIARKRFEDLRKTTMITFFKFCPPELIYKYDQSKSHLTFVNGSTIQFNHLEDIENIKSMDLGWFAIDEVTDIYYSDFQMLKSRLRYSISKPRANWEKVEKQGVTYYIPRHCGFMATNPEPGWVKKMFVDGIEPETGKKLDNPQDFSFTPSLSTDNPYNTDDYLADLRNNDPDWVKKYVEGNWTSLKGRIYNTFREETHVKEFKVLPHWELYRGIDYGFSIDPTTCIFVAIDENGKFYVFDEYWSNEQNKSTVDHVEEILMKYPENKFAFKHTVADTHALGGQLALDMSRLGLQTMKVKQHKITEGIAKVKVKLAKDYTDQPNLIIHPRCKHLIEELYEYEWKERKDTELNSSQEPKDKSNHCADPLRYLIVMFGNKKAQTKDQKKYISQVHDVFVPQISDATGY